MLSPTPRRAAALVRSRLRSFPAVVLVGPRQSGKTTLAKRLGGLYFDLEQPGERVRLERAADLIAADRRILISRTSKTSGTGRTRSTNLRGAIGAILRP